MGGDEDTSLALPAPIRRLDEAVVNRIAAGEVIQRPASALKEMLENSLDAGSTSINVVVKEGGLKMIQITDNGHGIRHGDLPILCERHTTSKLREFEDLQKINTLGFRGEALASISFVAHLTVVTMTEGQSHGYKATYQDGNLEGDAKPCAAVKGTQITVENLFYNVPTRRKAFKNPGEEYGRILDVISRYAVHNNHASFTCKKHGESRADVHTVIPAPRLECIRSVYGPSVARELIPISASSTGEGENASRFQMEGFISSANYSAKRTNMILFINNRLVECSTLKKACEAVYAAILPKASKPFLYMSIDIPPEDVDVNVHPTKREVSFLNQESLIEIIQRAVEEKLLESNTTRTFYTQTLLPGANIPPKERQEEAGTQKTSTNGPSQPAPYLPHKLVRTDELNPAGRMHAFLQKKHKKPEGGAEELAETRRIVRQRRNPSEQSQLTSVQELLDAIEEQSHAGLTEIVRHHTYVGMADDYLALLQNKTKLYLVDVVSLSKELIYQQVIRRFARFTPMRLKPPAPLTDLLVMALEDEHRHGRFGPEDGDKVETAKAYCELLQYKADMLKEYFGIEIDGSENLLSLPLILDQYSPDMDRLPQFILSLANSVDWDTEKECFESLAVALANFYAIYPPLLPRPRRKETSSSSDAGRNRAGSALAQSCPGATEVVADDTTTREAEVVVGSNEILDEEEEERGGGGEDGGRGGERPRGGGVGTEGEAEAIRADGGGGGTGDGRGGSGEGGAFQGEEEGEEDALAIEAERAWSQREWTIQHLMFPAMRLFLKPPSHASSDGTFVQVASLENLYKIFERC